MATRKPKSTAAVSQAQTPAALIELAKIKTLPQVRTEFPEETLAELAESIKTYGVLQPVLLRPQGEDYLVIAGERRIRAALIAGLSHVPALVGDADDETAATMQLIENIQREDLSLKDAAAGVLMLYERHKSLAAVGAIVNKSQSWVSKHLAIATRLSHQAQMLLNDGITEDLELLMTVSQIANLHNAWPRIDNLIEKIRAKKAGRKESRALLEQLRTEIEEAKAERKGKGTQQGELSLNEDQAREAKQATWEPGGALGELHDALIDPAHAPVAELVKGWDAKQQKQMARIPQHLEAHKLGQQVKGKTAAVKLRHLAGCLSRRMLLDDPFDMAAFILGAAETELSLQDLATEVHHIFHA